MLIDIPALVAKVNIVDVISRYRTLVKNGKTFKVLCPFHNDHKPSMIVDPEKNFCWCFACQNGGNAINFIQKIENISVAETFEILADISGIPLESVALPDQKKFSVSGHHAKEEKDMIREVLTLSLQFFTSQFQKSQLAKEYIFEQRKLTQETQKVFEIGFALDDFHALETFLLSKKISRQQMLMAGVVQEKDENAVYDKFRKRIMFPIYDALGKICGFGGRGILGEEPKYLNSPETLVYKKSEILFGYHLAKKYIREKDTALLVEGNIDVMMCHQCGFQNTIAASGIGFSANQASMLKRIASKVILAFDTDVAGMKASERILPFLFSQGLSVFMLQMTNGKDPDECLQSDVFAFQNAYESALPALLVLTRYKLNTAGERTVEAKRKILQDLFPIIETLPFPLEKDESIKMLAAELMIEEKIMNDEWNTFLRKEQKKYSGNAKIKKCSPEISLREHFWGMIFAFFSECEYSFQVLDPLFFIEDHEKTLYNSLLSAYTENRELIFEDISSLVAPEMVQLLQKSALYCTQQYAHLPTGLRREEIKKATDAMGRLLISQKIQHLLAHSPQELSEITFLTQSLKCFK